MPRLKNITKADVKDILRLTQPYYKKWNVTSDFKTFMSAEGSLCDIVLYKEAFPKAENLLPHKVLSYDTAPSTARKEDFICNIDSNLFRVAVLDIVDQYIDRKKYPCCYQRFFESSKVKVCIAGRFVYLNALEHATRMLLLCGLEQAELFYMDGGLKFVGRHEGKIAVCIMIGMARNDDESMAKCHKLNVGSNNLFFGSNSEIQPDLIHETIKALDAVNEKAAEYDSLFKKMYTVSLVAYTDVHVLAKSEAEARRIANEQAGWVDFDESFDIDSCTEISISDLPTYKHHQIYTNDGSVARGELDELIAKGALFVGDDDDDYNDDDYAMGIDLTMITKS